MERELEDAIKVILESENPEDLCLLNGRTLGLVAELLVTYAWVSESDCKNTRIRQKNILQVGQNIYEI